MQRFDGKRVIITGGGSGIGQATVLRLLSEGAKVAALDISEDGLRATSAMAGAGASLITSTIDIGSESSVNTAIAATISDLGGLDVLVNAAGILHSAHTHELPLELWNRVITVNLTGTFLVTKAALPTLLATGHGVVVNFGSTSAYFAHAYMAAYAASKGAIVSFTHTLAAEYAKQGLRAVAVCPGGIQTALTDAVPAGLPADTDWTMFAKAMPIIGSGMGEPKNVASVIAMLASEDGAYITGTEVRIDGGAHA
jgi:NAD(P)-dependent dehydrogenase (short-subunit alcohol dehydrogenase family)